LPETTERASWGHPNFLAGKKTFLTFECIHGRPSIAFRLDRVDIERLIRDERFFATPYGRGQWVSIWVDITFDWDFVRDLIVRGYRLVALRRMIAALDGVAPKR
jgi:predicted DNA-binding protein (MmcQ/YjbR family)